MGKNDISDLWDRAEEQRKRREGNSNVKSPGAEPRVKEIKTLKLARAPEGSQNNKQGSSTNTARLWELAEEQERQQGKFKRFLKAIGSGVGWCAKGILLLLRNLLKVILFILRGIFAVLSLILRILRIPFGS